MATTSHHEELLAGISIAPFVAAWALARLRARQSPERVQIPLPAPPPPEPGKPGARK